MKLHPFAATALSLLGVVVVSPSFAQDQPPPSDSKPAESEKKPTDRPANPPAGQDTPVAPDTPPTSPPPSDQTPPAPPPSPSPDIPPVPPPPEVAPIGSPAAMSPEALSAAERIDGFESFIPPPRDQATTPPIGEKLSPLLITAGFGLGYAAIKHPDLQSTSLTGSFIELTAGNELNHRFRLSFAFTSFQTTIHRVPSGWAEGDYPTTVAGLRAQADPVEPNRPPRSGWRRGPKDAPYPLHRAAFGLLATRIARAVHRSNDGVGGHPGHRPASGRQRWSSRRRRVAPLSSLRRRYRGGCIRPAVYRFAGRHPLCDRASPVLSRSRAALEPAPAPRREDLRAVGWATHPSHYAFALTLHATI